MDQRSLIHPMTAGDLVESAVVVAQQERGMGSQVETRLLEVVEIDAQEDWPAAYTFAAITFRDRQTNGMHVIKLKAQTPLLVTGISL